MKYILLILIALLGQYTFACDCEKPTFQAAYDSANLIFVGKATEVTTNWMSGGWKATFVVENSWKMPTEGVFSCEYALGKRLRCFVSGWAKIPHLCQKEIYHKNECLSWHTSSFRSKRRFAGTWRGHKTDF